MDSGDSCDEFSSSSEGYECLIDNESDDESTASPERTIAMGQGTQPYMFQPRLAEGEVVEKTCEVEDASPPSSPSPQNRLHDNNWYVFYI